MKGGLLGRDGAVEAVLAGEEGTPSQRTAQRRMVRTTGMTHTLLRQIERARHATRLLIDGMAIADVALEAGYFDQAHMINDFRALTGMTPTAYRPRSAGERNHVSLPRPATRRSAPR